MVRSEVSTGELLDASRRIASAVSGRGYGERNAFEDGDDAQLRRYLLRTYPDNVSDAAVRFVRKHVRAVVESTAFCLATGERDVLVQHCASGIWLRAKSQGNGRWTVDTNNSPYRIALRDGNSACSYADTGDHRSRPPWETEPEQFFPEPDPAELYTGLGIGTRCYRKLGEFLPDARFPAYSLRSSSLAVRKHLHVEDPWAWDVQGCPICGGHGGAGEVLDWNAPSRREDFNAKHAAVQVDTEVALR